MASKCSECKGPAKGRGYQHKAGCSKAKGSGSSNRRAAGAFKLSVVKGLDVVQLIEARDKIDGLIRDKAPELKAEISKLQKIHKTITA